MNAQRPFAWTCCLLFLAGCQLPERTTVLSSPPKYQVKCEGDCLELNAPSANPNPVQLASAQLQTETPRSPAAPLAVRSITSAADRATFVRKLEEYLVARQFASIDSMIERRLEVAIDLLQSRETRHAPTETELLLATAVDSRLGHPGNDGWHARLQGKGRGGLDRAEESLTRARELLSNEQWKAVRDLLQKSQTALAPYPYHAIQAGLLLSEAHRRLGDTAAAGQAWQQTAVLASRLATRWPAPALWEQLAAQRPATLPWPSEVAFNLLSTLPTPLQDMPKQAGFTPECLVWFIIGNARLQRNEASAALTAFKRVDSQGAFALWDDYLTLYQAKALLALEQTPAATSLLTKLVNMDTKSPWRAPALSLLGAGKLREGHSEQAYAFLREAVESSDANFSGRASAEANLGLIYLIRGDSANGLRWLHSAQNRFLASHDFSGLIQCLGNEADYLTRIGKAESARQIRDRIREIEGNGNRL